MARDDDSRQYEPVVGPDAVPLADSERDGRRLEVPLELVFCREPSPFERVSNGVTLVPVLPSRRQRRVPVSLERTLAMVGELPVGGERIFSA